MSINNPLISSYFPLRTVAHKLYLGSTPRILIQLFWVGLQSYISNKFCVGVQVLSVVGCGIPQFLSSPRNKFSQET